MTEKLLEYTHAGSTFEGLLVMPPAPAAPVPGVLIAHAWGGRGEVEADVARRLAQHNAGKGARTTRGRIWVLLHTERCKSKPAAMSREWHLKRDRKFRKRLAQKLKK